MPTFAVTHHWPQSCPSMCSPTVTTRTCGDYVVRDHSYSSLQIQIVGLTWGNLQNGSAHEIVLK